MNDPNSLILGTVGVVAMIVALVLYKVPKCDLVAYLCVPFGLLCISGAAIEMIPGI